MVWRCREFFFSKIFSFKFFSTRCFSNFVFWCHFCILRNKMLCPEDRRPLPGGTSCKERTLNDGSCDSPKARTLAMGVDSIYGSGHCPNDGSGHYLWQRPPHHSTMAPQATYTHYFLLGKPGWVPKKHNGIHYLFRDFRQTFLVFRSKLGSKNVIEKMMQKRRVLPRAAFLTRQLLI